MNIIIRLLFQALPSRYLSVVGSPITHRGNRISILNCFRRALVFCVFGCSIASAICARGVTIDFESLPGMQPQMFAPVPQASRLTDQLLLSHGVSFSQDRFHPYAAIVNAGESVATSGINGIGGVRSDLLFQDGTINISFFVPGEPNTVGHTDFVSVRGDWLNRNWMEINAFDDQGVFIAYARVFNYGGSTLSFSWPTPIIHRVSIHGNGTGFNVFTFDDLTFNEIRAIPEPSSLNLGLIAVGSSRVDLQACKLEYSIVSPK